MLARILALAFTFCLICHSTVNADEITLIPVTGFSTGANINALAGPLFSSDIDTIDIAGPGSGTASASKSGNLATHTYAVELDYSITPAFFDSVYSSPFSRTSTLDHRASAESIFHFTVDVPTVYEAMGFFDVVDDSGTTVPGNVELEIELLEFDSFDPFAPPPETVFYSYQVSKSTIDESFDVGMLEGDDASVLIGGPTGLLDPSKFYRYRTLVTINAIDIDGSGPLLPTDGGASAAGAHVIMFSPASVVPEPSALSLLLIGALVVLRRRSRRAVA